MVLLSLIYLVGGSASASAAADDDSTSVSCLWSKVTNPPSTGSFCADHDGGHAYDAAKTNPITFGEAVCTTAPTRQSFNAALPSRAFFYGSDDGNHFVWCSNTCASGCAASMPQCNATYVRHCDGPPPTTPPAPPAPGVLGNLNLVDASPRGAACLDGSRPGYWIRKATSASVLGHHVLDLSV